MSHVAVMAVFSAALLGVVGALFGVCTARLIWADDLAHARRIDETRSRTEASLREVIKQQQRSIAAQTERIEILKSRLGETQ